MLSNNFFNKKKHIPVKQSKKDAEITEELTKAEAKDFLKKNPNISEKLKSLMQSIIDR